MNRGLIVLLATALALAAAPAPERLWPVAPEDRARTGSRPLFELGFAGFAGRVGALRLRLVLEDAGGRRRVHDRGRRAAGWSAGADGRLLYRPARPLSDGTWHWHAAAWDGVAWVRATPPRELHVDTVPPDDVTGLVLRRPVGEPRIELSWDPVTLDRRGRPEYVEHYHVYRYERAADQPVLRHFRVGTTPTPRFVDDTPTDPGFIVLYYRVTAEDAAGNEAGRRD